MNDNSALGNSYVNGRVETSTKKQYESKLGHFRKWIEIEYPDLITAEDTIDFRSIDRDTYVEFYGHISKKRDTRHEEAGGPFLYYDPVQYQSFEHVSGYKSAIVYELRRLGIPRDDSMTAVTRDLFAGYKRKVAKLKQTGEMKPGEGKMR